MNRSLKFKQPDARAIRARPLIAAWLLFVAVMVAAMVILGGATRLTHSGLSMVQWQPLMGILPPVDEAAWRDVFARYKQYPEYLRINQGMTLDEFKGIFYFEYSHRIFGRVIGLVFAIPFIFFLLSGRIERRRWLVLFGLLLAGGLRGLIGWWMVKSGLVDQPDVSQYRLAVHLGMAFLILGGLIWVALDLLAQPAPAPKVGGKGLLWSKLVVVVIFIQVLSGALVAGLDGGLVYNSFPMMNEYWLPPELGDLSPGWLNLFENPVTVQFDHRIGAYVCTLAVLALWFRMRGLALAPLTRRALHMTLAALVLQLALGIVTLLWIVPVPLAILHQGGALVLFAAAVHLMFRLHQRQGE
ncbi:MAG: heme A synthase [Rhodospirillaceae bacterium]|nr:heme A synthase [Rhodospirillaceae bacterium]